MPPSTVLVTGAAGFLGWHLQIRLRALTDHVVRTVDQHNWHELPQLIADADAVIHLAGINRASDDELRDGNRRLAEQLVQAAEHANAAPRLIYANSIQAGNETPYGDGKAAAAHVLHEAATRWGTPFVDVMLPNLFGEHGRPGYNSFVATFVERAIAGDHPDIQDRDISLLHAQRAAQCFIDALDGPTRIERPDGTPTSVTAVWQRLLAFREVYEHGRIPPLPTDFDVELFNTYRAALFPARYPLQLTLNSDPRGWLVETTRWSGGEGQTFVSSTHPGITRGEHFHLRKIERFVVVGGQGRIRLRKASTSQTVQFDVDGNNPVAIDMPIGWIHNITNTGDSEMVTQFWVNELFDPADPDTFWEPVDPQENVQ